MATMTSSTLETEIPSLPDRHDAPASPRPRTTRVLHVINGEHYAGAERVQDLLALRLPRQGFDVSFACIKPGQFGEVRQSHSSPIYPMPMRHKLDLRLALELAALVRREGFELIHTHTARSALVGSIASRVAGVPMVHHVHSPATADTEHPLRNRMNAAAERLSVRRASAVIAVSNSLARYVDERRLSRQPAYVVPNGVRARGALSQRTTPTGRWTLGAMALFRPRKGVEVLLEAMGLLVGEGHDVHLRAIGAFETSDYENEVKQLAERLGLSERITWRGFQRNIDGELAATDLFVLPSLFGEGMPMVLLEAMAVGVPVVATRVEGVPELVRDRTDGVIVEAASAPSLAEGLKQVMSGAVDWQALRTSAHQRQVEQFSDVCMSRSVADIYRNVLAGHRPVRSS